MRRSAGGQRRSRAKGTTTEGGARDEREEREMKGRSERGKGGAREEREERERKGRRKGGERRKGKRK